MRGAMKHTKCILSVLLLSLFSVVLSAQVPNSVIQTLRATTAEIQYQIRLSSDDPSGASLVKALKQKQDVYSCQLSGDQRVITISTSPEITEYMVMTVVRQVGYENTFQLYRQAIRLARPQKERRQEIR